MPPLFILDHPTIHQNSGFPQELVWHPICASDYVPIMHLTTWSLISGHQFCVHETGYLLWTNKLSVGRESLGNHTGSMQRMCLIQVLYLDSPCENIYLDSPCEYIYRISLWNIYRFLCLNKTCPLEIEEKQTKKGNISNTYFAAISRQFFVISF